MEAKDTVMVEPQMEIALKDYGLFAINAYPLEIYTLLEAQAEISFPLGKQEGRKEVVDFVNPLMEKIAHFTSDIGGDWTDPRYECDCIYDLINEWRAKEWGIE